MYQLLLKQRFKFAVRMIKRNIGAYLILIAIVPCILILQSMIQKNYGMDIAVFIPYGILCFLFMNLFGTIPRMRISPETYIWKIEKTYIWRVKKIGKSMVLTLSVALILFWAFPMEGMVLRQFIVAMLCNPIVNMHTVLSTQYKYRDIMNICMLAVVMICFFYGSVFVTSILLIIYGLYFILYPYFSYQAIIPFFQQYNQMLYGFLNREYDTVLQTQDEVFFQNNQKEMKGLMKKYYGSRYRFLMVYEVVSIVRRKKQIMYQYFAIVLITMLLSQIDGKYIEYKLENSIHEYQEIRGIVNDEIKDILNSVLVDNGLSPCTIINIGEVISRDILSNRHIDIYHEAMEIGNDKSLNDTLRNTINAQIFQKAECTQSIIEVRKRYDNWINVQKQTIEMLSLLIKQVILLYEG